MFTLNHFILLGICFLLIALALIISFKYKLTLKKACYIFFAICLISEFIKVTVNIIPNGYGGYVVNQKDIPIHLCSLIVFAMFFVIASKNENFKKSILCMIATLGIIAPIFAILIPTEGVDLTKLQTYQFFIYHAALLWFSIYLIATKQLDFGLNCYKRHLLALTFYMFMALYINSALASYDANFIFLSKPPLENLPILNLDNGWLPYFIIMLCIGYGYLTIFHLPFIIKERKQKS